MDLNQAEKYLEAQMKKREGAITEEQSNAFNKFWKANNIKIHNSLIEKCKWDNELKSLNWRIDVKSRTRTTEQLNMPTAIVEMQLANKLTPTVSTCLIKYIVHLNSCIHL